MSDSKQSANEELRNALRLCMRGMCGYCRMDAEARGMSTKCVNGCEALRVAKAALDRNHVEANNMAALRDTLSGLRSQLYGVAASIRALTARSDARERGVHYTEVQNIAAQIENIADKGGEV